MIVCCGFTSTCVHSFFTQWWNFVYISVCDGVWMNNLISRNLTFSPVDRHASDKILNLVCDHIFRELFLTILSRSYFSIFNHSWFLSQGLAWRPFLDMNHVNSLAPWTALMADIKWRLQYRIWKELRKTVFQKIRWTA